MAFNKEKVMEAARKFVEKGQLDKASRSTCGSSTRIRRTSACG
jgi:hypothetical protein